MAPSLSPRSPAAEPQYSLNGTAGGRGWTWLQAWARWIFGGLLAATTAFALAGPFRHRETWMDFVQDDFFYYLKVAQNLAAGHGSTFNGLVATNGYHPLWLALLAAAVRAGAAGRGVPLFLVATCWLATMAMYVLALRLLRRAGVQELPAVLLAGYTAVYSMHLFQLGMEITLATPLLLGLVVGLQAATRWPPQQAHLLRWGGLGLLTAMMVLSRLDTIVFAAMLAVAWAATPALRRGLTPTHLGALAVGLLPLPAYFLSNHVFFGVWMPVSGMAKQLKLDHGFTGQAWHWLLFGSRTQPLHLIPIVVALMLLPWWWRAVDAGWRPLYLATLLYPFVYCAALSWLSDWPLWLWYFYDLRPAFCVAILVLLQLRPIAALGQRSLVLAAAAVFVFAAMVSMRWKPQYPAIIAAAHDLQDFATTHPGVYAMGDRSGAPGLLLTAPLVQTEGLMMDVAFLGEIRRQAPLREVLGRYGVRYYVGTSFQAYTGCFHAQEPYWGGPHTPKMRGEFCDQPVAHFVHEGVHTLVFELQPTAGQ